MSTQKTATTEEVNPALVDAETTFDDFELHPDIARALGKMGFDKPTPVQAQTFKLTMQGVDIIAMAQTGTGKTAAFGIPLVQRLGNKDKGVAALALVPTRELALQVCREIAAIGDVRGVKCAPIYGGASFTKQVSEVEKGARIIVGTPGRVLDHIKSKSISFDKTEILVLDEADEMLSMGFEKEISEIIESLPKKRQNLLFSATIPDDMARLTKRYMDSPTVISVSGDEVGAKEISHYVYLISGQGRPNDMVNILELERPDSAIIFCNTRDETQLLAKHLKKSGYNADWLNSDLSQNEREIVMKRTRSGKIQFLVATDVAARGIDVSHLSHVINYTFPDSLEIYIHRTGRTGRMGRRGTAISLIAPQNIGNLYYLRLTYKIFPIEKSLSGDGSKTRSLEIERIEGLRKNLGETKCEAYQSLARRVTQDLDAERIIATLLSAYFSDSPAKIPQRNKNETARKKTIEDPKKSTVKQASPQSKSTKKRDEKFEKPQRKQSQPKKVEPKAKKPGTSPKKPPTKTQDKGDADEGPTKEIFIDAGRKDGLRISHLMKEIQRITDLPRSALGKVRMLTRSAFVSVPGDHFQAILKAISQIELSGKRLKAEPAEQS